MSSEPLIIDASGLILGRMASHVAKLALEGRAIIIVNAEKAVISGNRKSIIYEVKKKMGTRSLTSQEKAPSHPRRPDLYVRRAIRGMLPRKKSSGKEAFKRVKVYINVPEEYASKPAIRISVAEASRLKRRYITIEDLSKEIGKV